MSESRPQEILMNLRIRKTWELLDRFKGQCELRGWKTSEHEDWVKTGDDKYHLFLWIQTVHPSTFEKICAHHKVAIRKAVSYHVVDVSYMAWFFLQSPPENIIRKVEEDPVCSRRTAMYDLSQAFTGKPICLQLNKTDSEVFRDFERFLERELEMEIAPIHRTPILRMPPPAHV